MPQPTRITRDPSANGRTTVHSGHAWSAMGMPSHWPPSLQGRSCLKRWLRNGDNRLLSKHPVGIKVSGGMMSGERNEVF